MGRRGAAPSAREVAATSTLTAFRERVRAHIRGFVLSDCARRLVVAVVGASGDCRIEFFWGPNSEIRAHATSPEGVCVLTLEVRLHQQAYGLALGRREQVGELALELALGQPERGHALGHLHPPLRPPLRSRLRRRDARQPVRHHARVGVHLAERRAALIEQLEAHTPAVKLRQVTRVAVAQPVRYQVLDSLRGGARLSHDQRAPLRLAPRPPVHPVTRPVRGGARRRRPSQPLRAVAAHVPALPALEARPMLAAISVGAARPLRPRRRSTCVELRRGPGRSTPLEGLRRLHPRMKHTQRRRTDGGGAPPRTCSRSARWTSASLRISASASAPSLMAPN